MTYQSTKLGELRVTGATVPPFSNQNLEGNLQVNAQALAGLILASLFGGESEFDSSQFHFYARLDAPIFGIIPYSLSKEYSYEDFQDMFADMTKREGNDNSDLINPFN